MQRCGGAGQGRSGWWAADGAAATPPRATGRQSGCRHDNQPARAGGASSHPERQRRHRQAPQQRQRAHKHGGRQRKRASACTEGAGYASFARTAGAAAGGHEARGTLRVWQRGWQPACAAGQTQKPLAASLPAPTRTIEQPPDVTQYALPPQAGQRLPGGHRSGRAEGGRHRPVSAHGAALVLPAGAILFSTAAASSEAHPCRPRLRAHLQLGGDRPRRRDVG